MSSVNIISPLFAWHNHPPKATGALIFYFNIMNDVKLTNRQQRFFTLLRIIFAADEPA
jgi:hypothetical protein